MADTFTPGLLKDLKVVLKNADGSRSATITNLILQMSITEDIFKNTLYGAVRIRDATDLLGGLPSKFPILGEEFLEIDYAVDWKPEPVKKSLRFAVYKISDIAYNQNNTKKEYTLHICSEEHLIDATYVVMKAYSGQHSDNVKALLQDFLYIDKKDTPFKGKRIKKLDKLQETKGQQNICIPRLPPLQAAQLIARRSISASEEFSSGTYLFFENFNGFNFCDVEYLIKTGVEKAKKNGALKNDAGDFRYVFENPTVDTQGNQPREVHTILNMHHVSFFDTVEKLKSGMFESDVLVFDYVNKTTTPTRFRFLDNKDKTNSKSMALGGQKELSFPENSVTFMNSVISKDDKDVKYSRFFMIPKDLSQTNNDTYLDQIYPARASFFTRLAQNMMTLDVYGNPNVNAGDAIFLQIPEGNPNNNSMTNRFTSGFYLVCTINHIFTQTTYQAKWDVYKNAFSAQVDSTDETQQTKVTPADNKSKTESFNADPVNYLPPVQPDENTSPVAAFLKQFL